MRGFELGMFLLALAAPVSTFAQTPQAPANAACTAPAHRALDFWLGQWRVFVTGTTAEVGASTITREDDGCVIAERFRSDAAAYSGHSLNSYSEQTQHWEQFWVDNTGDITHFIGNARSNGGMQMTAEDDVGPNQPTPIFSRITWSVNADGSVRQHGEASHDRGVTWADRYDLTYKRAP